VKARIDRLPLEGESLAPVWLITGDEPLQLDEAAAAIRGAARARGFSERELYSAETGFDWGQITAAAQSLSLFGERKLIELRLPSGKPGDAGSKALIGYCAAPPEENLLLVITGKLDKRDQSSKWFQALDQAGVVVQVWPVEPRALPAWVERRMRLAGLEPTREAAQLLAERAEGNLLAAAQEVEKLRLLLGEGARIDLEAVRSAVVESARFNVFELADAALLGDAPRTARMVAGLRAEGSEPPVVLWALAREIRTLASIAGEVARGTAPDQAIAQKGVWAKRRPLFATALERYGVNGWRRLLRRAQRIDRIIKGAQPGNAWDELVQLALLVAGVRLV